MKIDVVVHSEIKRSARVVQVGGIFDVAPAEKVELKWRVDMPIEERPWNIGLIVGPSGSGKSTIARHAWPTEFAKTFTWPADRSLLDAFPEAMAAREIVDLLSSVGFSSPPAWMRPFAVLSNGEQFRVTLARTLAEAQEVSVIDEFTSVVDRTVAQIGSAALAKTVRRRNQKFVAVTCHEDVEDWLQPDWVYRPGEKTFAWRSLQQRPAIELTINRVHHSAWRIFKRHHYLTEELSTSAVCFVAFWKGRPVAFDSWLPFVGRLKDSRGARRAHRTVCLPDFQGVGIGSRFSTFLASMWTGLGERALLSTGHPALISARRRSKDWKMTRAPSMSSRDTSAFGRAGMAATRATERLTASFEYIGPKMPRKDAERLLHSTV